MKHEWRKKEKEYYVPKNRPEIVNIPEFKFITLKGQGDPNKEEYGRAVEALYTIAYAIKMMPKKDITPEGYFDYTVYPLEGVWDLTEKGRQLDILDKDEFVYTIMIRQPEFVTEEVFIRAKEIAKKKKNNELIDNVRFETSEEEKCVQMLHIGSFDDEPETFEIMEEYCKENGLERKYKTHREIYLSDPRKVEVEKLKTVLRFNVKNH